MRSIKAIWQVGRMALVIVGLSAAPVAAAPLILDALDSGSYRSDGLHIPANENYLTGLFEGIERRGFFLFDLSSVSGTFTGATLRLFNPEVSQFLHGYVSPDATETLNIYDVSASAADLAGGVAGVAGFTDLGSGALYGSQVVSAADNGLVVEIALNAAALADLNAAGGLFLLGSALGTIGAGDQYVFGFSMTNFVADHTRQLVLDVALDVPEPSTFGLLGLGSFFVAMRRRRA